MDEEAKTTSLAMVGPQASGPSGLASFSQKLKATVSCEICFRLLHQPFTTACLHSFCYSCLDEWCKQAGNVTCPSCRVPIRSIPKPAFQLQEMIDLCSAEPEVMGSEFEENKKTQLEAVQIVEEAKTDQKLFGKKFRLAGVITGRLKAMRDPSDNVWRCGNCNWELDRMHCASCQSYYDRDGWQLQRGNTDSEYEYDDDEDVSMADIVDVFGGPGVGEAYRELYHGVHNLDDELDDDDFEGSDEYDRDDPFIDDDGTEEGSEEDYSDEGSAVDSDSQLGSRTPRGLTNGTSMVVNGGNTTPSDNRSQSTMTISLDDDDDDDVEFLATGPGGALNAISIDSDDSQYDQPLQLRSRTRKRQIVDDDEDDEDHENDDDDEEEEPIAYRNTRRQRRRISDDSDDDSSSSRRPPSPSFTHAATDGSNPSYRHFPPTMTDPNVFYSADEDGESEDESEGEDSSEDSSEDDSDEEDYESDDEISDQGDEGHGRIYSAIYPDSDPEIQPGFDEDDNYHGFSD